MAWGAFCGIIRSELFFVLGQAKLDSATYVQEILDPLLLPFWHQCCEEYSWTMIVEDGASGHQKHAKTYRELNNMASLIWPPQSPDLNLIEAIWQEIENELGMIWGRAKNLLDIQQQSRITWHTISDIKFKHLIESMPSRLQAVIDAEGRATPY